MGSIHCLSFRLWSLQIIIWWVFFARYAYHFRPDTFWFFTFVSIWFVSVIVVICLFFVYCIMLSTLFILHCTTTNVVFTCPESLFYIFYLNSVRSYFISYSIVYPSLFLSGHLFLGPISIFYSFFLFLPLSFSFFLSFFLSLLFTYCPFVFISDCCSFFEKEPTKILTYVLWNMMES